MTARISCFLTLLLGLGSPALAGTSVYTKADTEHCKSLLTPEEEDPEMGNISAECKGYKDYLFYFREGDVRQSTYFGFADPQIVDQAAETFERFNHIGDKIEWRLDARGTPRATILRYFMENLDPVTSQPNEKLYGQILVVSRVAQPDDGLACITAYVDALANPDANAMAQKLADEQAPTFACGKEKPVFHGKVGDRISEPVYNYPDLSEAK